MRSTPTTRSRASIRHKLVRLVGAVTGESLRRVRYPALSCDPPETTCSQAHRHDRVWEHYGVAESSTTSRPCVPVPPTTSRCFLKMRPTAEPLVTRGARGQRFAIELHARVNVFERF